MSQQVEPPRLVSLPHPLTGAGREVSHVAFRQGETLGEYVKRTGVKVASGLLAVQVNGRPLSGAWKSYRVIDGDYIVLRQVVSGGGGDGAKVLRTVALVALAIYAPQFAMYLNTSMGLGLAAGGVGMGLLTAGIIIGGSLLINALLPPPKPSVPSYNAAAAEAQLYTLNGGRNAARLYEPMPLVIGRHKIVPDLASQPYTEQWGDSSYLYQAFHLGVQPDLVLDDLKIGETPLSSFSEVVFERAGADGKLGLVAGNVDTVAGFDLLPADGWVARTLSRDTVEIQVELAARLYYANDDGSISQQRADIELEYRPVGAEAWLPAGEEWVTELRQAYWSRGYWGTETVRDDSGENWGSTSTRTVWVQTGFDANTAAGAHVDGAATGNWFGGWVYREVWRWRPYSEIDPAGANNVRGLAPDRVIRTYRSNRVPLYGASATNPTRKTIRLPVELGQYEVRARKTNADGTSSRGSNSAAVSQIRSYQIDTGDYAGHNRIAIKVRATSQLNGAIDQLNGGATAACPVWTGSGWVTQATVNPAWWFLWFARGRKDAAGRRLYGAGLADGRIDIEAIKAWAAWCDSKKLTCSLLVTQQKSIADVLATIARCGRASPTWQTGRLGVVWDRADLPVTAIFGPPNIKAGSFRVDYIGDQTADEVIVQFINPAKGWQQDEVRQTVPGVEYPGNPTTLNFEGCTDPDMAGREANLIAASQIYHRRRISWETDVEGFVANRGDVVLLSHDLTAWGICGRLMDGGGQVLVLDKPVPNVSGWIMLRHPEGGMATVRIKAVAEDGMTVTLAEPLGLPLPSDQPDIVPFDWMWMFDPLATPGRRVKIVSVEPQGEDGVRFSAVDDNPDYYACESDLYHYVPPKDRSLFAAPVFDLRASEGQADIATGEVAVRFEWTQVVPSQVEVAWQTSGGASGRQVQNERSIVIRARTGETIDLTVTPQLLTGPGQSATLRYTVLGYLSALPAVTGLTTVYRDALLLLSWRPVIDYRQPAYELRIGASWDDGRSVGVTPLSEIVAVGSGDYWVAARWQAPSGQIVYGPAAGLDVSGASLVRNVLVTRDEQPAWSGALAGAAWRRGAELILAGSGSLLDCADVLNEPDVLWYGGINAGGSYTTAAPVDVGRVVPCLLSFDLSVRGESTVDSVLAMANVLAEPDFLGATNAAFVQVHPQIRTAGDDGSWSAWRDYVPGLVLARHFDVRLELESRSTTVLPVVERFSWTVDMPDRLETGTAITVPAAGLAVSYAPAFNGGPGGAGAPNVQITVLEAQPGDEIELTGSTLTGFTIRIRNGPDYLSRRINWLAQGY